MKMMMMMSTVSCILKLIFVMLQFYLLFSYYSGAVADAKHVGCIEKERHALLELKASMVLGDSYLLPTWDSKSYGCCSWEGIVCSNQTDHVEMLDLNGYQFGPFIGEINASLMELQHLKYLNLSLNSWSYGIFPEFIGSLSNLRFLDVQSSFNGGRIPNDLARLSHLQYLDLSNNGLQGTIPHQLGNLSHLQYLNLSWNLLGTIPHQLGNLSHLQHLDLSYNFLDGTIPHQLGNLSHLQYLNLSSNDFVGTIPHQLGNLSYLQYLDLSWNDLVGTIPHQLGSLSNLQVLHLEYNEGLKVNDKNNDVGGEWLSNLTHLTHLDLGYLPNLNSSHVWLQMIAKLPKIQELTLSGCDLSDHYLLSLSGSQLNFSTSLAMLDLSWNTFSSSKIFEWVFNATSNLIELDLSGNNLKGTIAYCCEFEQKTHQ
ncbi:receptor protein EIX2 [Trifolium repens]|nr:receptor protein EIX2 [Trifolium repens]